MKFKRIEIKSFGKFKNFEFEFQDVGDMQIIYGPNEYGKSTIMEFIKIMLYGRRGKEITVREDKILRNKYTPWNEPQVMEGTIEFFHDGCEYRLQKKLNSSSPLKDIVELYNISIGEVVRLGKKEEIGEHLFKMDLKTFEKSCYIGDIGKAEFGEAKENEDNLSEKILNFSLSGNMNISVNKAILRINKAINELKSLKGDKGKIPLLKSQISNLNESIYNLKNFEKEQLNLLEKISETKKLIEEKIFLKNRLQSIKEEKEISLVRNLIKLLKNKENYINKIERIGILYNDLNDILKTITLIKKEIDLQSCKISEIKKFVFLKDKKPVCISDDEIKKLNSKITLKENLENKIRIIVKLKFESIEKLHSKDNLNSCFRPYVADEIYNTLEKYIICKHDLEELKEIRNQEEKKDSVSEIKLKKEALEKSLKDKDKEYPYNIKKKYIYSLIQMINMGAFFGVCYFTSPYHLYLFILLSIFGALSFFEILNFKKLKHKMYSLQEEVEKLTLMIKNSKESQFKISSTSENAENLKRKIVNLISEENNYLNCQIERVNNFINKLLMLKKAPNIHDY